jgi:multiple sugar transport system permease protein/N,N'-diacetylchitobiose transport system permease protein
MSRLTAAPRRLRPGSWSESWAAGAFVTPAAIAILLIVAYPLVRAFWLSLHDVVLTRPGEEPFVGLQNYAYELTNPDFWAAVGRSLFFTVFSTAIEVVLGVGLALLMDQPLRGRWLLRTLVILPWALPTIVNALMWRWIDNAEYGALNALLYQTGLIDGYRQWLSDPSTAMWMVIIADAWKMTPLVAILVLAALQGISREQLEAARVDGAGSLAALRYIILPLLTPTILIVLVLRTMEAFKVFDIIWIMTNGGPANTTQTIAIYAYQTAFRAYNFGRGAALGYLIALAIMILAALYLRLLGRVGRS